mmetsp:Transcript_27607/g.63987  ORF Transcript_27607/g.63987 Transcript_27607/m.63987 type:complete len:193 (+) Transcript_27607:33-611(+)
MATSSKRVTFQDSEPVWREPELDFDDIDHSSYWYATSDLGARERENRATFRALRRARGDTANFDHDKYCFRGLEDVLIPEYGDEMMRRREIARIALLEEQMLQSKRGENDPEALRVVSLEMSHWSRGVALELGAGDAAIVREGNNGEAEFAQFQATEDRVTGDGTLPSVDQQYFPGEIPGIHQGNHIVPASA